MYTRLRRTRHAPTRHAPTRHARRARRINVELAADPNPRVLLLSLQPLTTKSDVKIVPYTDDVAKQFLSYDEIIASVKPKNLPIIS